MAVYVFACCQIKKRGIFENHANSIIPRILLNLVEANTALGVVSFVKPAHEVSSPTKVIHQPATHPGLPSPHLISTPGVCSHRRIFLAPSRVKARLLSHSKSTVI